MTILSRLLAASTAAFVICLAAPAHAAEPPVKPAASAEALELAGRYVALMQMDRQLESFFKALMPPLLEREFKRIPEATPALKEGMTEVMLEVLNEMGRDLVNDLPPVIAQTFTVEELRAAVAFYDSPEGRSMTAKSQGLSVEISKLTKERSPLVERELIKRMCERFGCPGPEPRRTES